MAGPPNLPGGGNRGNQQNQGGSAGQYIFPLTANVLNLVATLFFIGLLLLGVEAYHVPETERYLPWLPSPGAFMCVAAIMYVTQILFIRLAAGKTG